MNEAYESEHQIKCFASVLVACSDDSRSMTGGQSWNVTNTAADVVYSSLGLRGRILSIIIEDGCPP